MDDRPILSEKEKRVYDYICKSFEENGYAPSVRDICRDIGISSTSVAHSYITKLLNKNYLSGEAGKSRTLRPRNASSVYRVPILGKITAGAPIYAYEENLGTVPFISDGRHYDPSELFALKVRGSSMTGVGIFDGDTVIVQQCSSCDDGCVVVALIDDEATVKTLYREEGRVRLQPENPDYEPIYSDNVRILGRVISCIRYY